MIWPISTAKPMSSMRSASSSTRKLHAREVERPAAQVVEHAARGADDHVGPGADALELALHGVAAVDRLAP